MLYLVPTPIGNLGDITLRAIEVLKSCDCVYCEDTRHTLQLLNHLGIHKPLVSCHQHNESARIREVCDLVRSGKDVAYASDAGMPGISDPGAVLLSACAAEGLPCTVLPGPSALLPAAVLSGLPVQPFTFFGFLPRDGKARREELARVRACGHLAILYESPLRVKKTLEDLLETLGDAPASLSRELSKKFEEVLRGMLSELIARLDAPPKGECVICVLAPEPVSAPNPQDAEALIRQLLSDGLSVREASAEAARTCGLPKNAAYRLALTLSGRQA